ncbi:MAG: DUF692 domain-containing protein [Pseudomonadota bacterium]|nr:DUF692 domain-containing protein [Pseudomonadota bacterium]
MGLGLRSTHVAEVLRDRPDIPWFEILADNYLATGGAIPRQLATVREHYPLTFHCVGMSLGGTDPLDMDYLKAIRRLVRDAEPAWVSDHLSFTRFRRHNYHDLLPLPCNEEALRHLSSRIQFVQEFLGRRILVENVSSYLSYQASDIDEADFIAELLERADCELLLDINNVYVNAVNHGFDARAYLDRIPVARVREIHLAGYETREGYLLDAHNHPVTPPVWRLYEDFVRRQPDIPTLIEWDKDIPAFEVLQAEGQKAEALVARHVDTPAEAASA